MKKITLSLIISAMLLMSACSSSDSNSVTLTGSEAGLAANEAGAEQSTELSDPSADFEPPQLLLELDGTRTALTVGSYTWNDGGFSSTSLADPIAIADSAPDAAVINTDGRSGSPLLLAEGGEISSVMCYRDSSDCRSCTVSGNNLTLYYDSSYDVYSVTVDYPQGSCEYVFKTVIDDPPTLRLRAGNEYHALSCGNYEWEQVQGEETISTIACGASPWENRENVPQVDLGGEVKGVLMLPDEAEIESVCAYFGGSDFEDLAFNGRTFDLPADPLNKVYAINVAFPHGRCEYVFGTFTGDAETWEVCGLPLNTDTSVTTDSSEPTEAAQPPESPLPSDFKPADFARTEAEYTTSAGISHHHGSHHGHHGYAQRPLNYISDCRLDDLSFYAYGCEVSTKENYKRDYEGEITDSSVKAELWDIITKQELQSEAAGDWSYTGTPYVEITDNSTGKVYTVSYTTMITYGSCHGICPTVVGHVCETPNVYTPCMRISCGISTEYAATDSAERFNELVMNSLKQYEPVRDAVFNKSAKTDWIVFVERYTNNAWGRVDQGRFIDCYGNAYSFDFSDSNFGDADEDFFNALWQVYCDHDPDERGLYDEDKLFDILIDDVYRIDENAKMSETDSGGADMGQYTLYVADGDGRLITLRSEGDLNYYLEDDTAKRLCDFFDNDRLS